MLISPECIGHYVICIVWFRIGVYLELGIWVLEFVSSMASATSSEMSFTTIRSARPEILTASSRVRRQKGQAVEMTLAPKLRASLIRISPFRVPVVPPSAHILPPPPSQQRLLSLDLSISTKSNPGMNERILLGSSKILFCLPRKHGS